MSEERDSWSSISSNSSLPQNKRFVLEKEGGRGWVHDGGYGEKDRESGDEEGSDMSEEKQICISSSS